MTTDSRFPTTRLGSTGLEVSRLCLGCMNFGSSAEWMMNDADASIDLIHEALDAGINFLDTANVYSTGESEAIVGEAIASRDREDLVVATKVFGEMRDGPNGQGLSRKHILDQIEGSLDRLGTDYVDLYQIHRWDEQTPIEETLSALDHLVETGRVRYIGASTMSAYQLTKALYSSDVEDYERFTCLQPEYSAVARHEEANTLPVAEGEGLGVIPWSPLASGFLTGKYEREADAPEGSRGAASEYVESRYADENWAVLDTVRDVAETHDATPAQVAIAWLLEQDVVTAPIIGPKTSEQLHDLLGAVELDLTTEDVDRIADPITPRWPVE
jgi:aryl-alcohol dehydrogenase-like predicted oxidoreductase